MLRFFSAAALLLSLPLLAQNEPEPAQKTTEMWEVDIQDLPANVVQKLKEKEEAKKVAPVSEGKAASDQSLMNPEGLGRTVGASVNRVVTAVDKNSNKLVESDLGIVTVFLIGYEVAGETVLDFIVGVIVLALCLPAWFWSYSRNCVVRRKLNLQTSTPDVQHFDIVYPHYGQILLHTAVLVVALLAIYSWM